MRVSYHKSGCWILVALKKVQEGVLRDKIKISAFLITEISISRIAVIFGFINPIFIVKFSKIVIGEATIQTTLICFERKLEF